MSDGFDFGEGFKPSTARLDGERDARRELASRAMPFGIGYLDDYCIGIHPTDLVVLCASSGAGKTTIAALIAQLACARGKRVHFFALEAHTGEIEQRMLFREICDLLRERQAQGLTYQQWMYNTVPVSDAIEDEARKRFESRIGGMFTYYRGEKFNADDIVKRFAEVRSETDLVVLDHLHYVDSDDQNENRGLKEITKVIRDAALSMGKPVIVVAHLRKKDRGKPRIVPEMDDVHGSSDIVKIATKVIALAPARDRANADPSLSATYMQVVKDRIRGASSFAALCAYDLRTLKYHDSYALGRVSYGGDEFEHTTALERPQWAKRALCLGTPIDRPKENA